MRALKLRIWLVLSVFVLSVQASAGSEDDPLLFMVKFDELELRDPGDDNLQFLKGEAWLGYDLHKLLFKIEAERIDGSSEEVELQTLYHKAIAPHWNLQLGWRRDFQPAPNRNWLVVGVSGLAPYYVAVDSALFIGEAGRAALRLKAEYELLLSQRLVLTPKIEMNFYTSSDEATESGSGLVDTELSLHLRYEIRPRFAPYIGVYRVKKFGRTADFARHHGETTSEVQAVAGIHAWF